MIYRNFYVFLILLLLIAASSCHSQKKLQRRGGYVLVKNSVHIDNPYIPTDEAAGFIMQKPLTRGLNILKPGVWVYESTLKGKQSNFKKKIREKFGTAPVILDTNLASQSEHNIRLYLQKKGFYHPQISHHFNYRRTTATAHYSIITGKPYTVENISYSILDDQLRDHVMKDTSESLLRKGMIFDTYLLDDERDRISLKLRNQGYYNFTKSNINYRVDTLGRSFNSDIELRIRQIESGNDTSAQVIPRYFLRNIYVFPDVELMLQKEETHDTLAYRFRLHSGDSLEQVIHVINGGKNRLNPRTLASVITLRSGQMYSQSSVTQTYKRLIGMPVIRSANIGLDIPEGVTHPDLSKQWLDCTIKLTRNPVNLLSIGTEGTNSGGSFGLGFNTLYQNRNIFKGAETFRIKITTGAEVQGNTQISGEDRKLLIFNALEAGIETGIDFPRLLIPYALLKNDRNLQARTSVTAGIGFETRPDYSRNITTFSGSYQWSASQRLKHVFTPLEINFVGIEKDSAFQSYLNTLTDPQFLGQYNDHLLTTIRYSIIYSNLSEVKENFPFFFRATVETSGNGIYLMDKFSGSLPTEAGYYERFGTRYAQYSRLDLDFRKFWNRTENQTLAFRVMAGIGLPYGNSEGIPFEKSFWLGGANDMRGWRLRSLGPGGYSNDSIRYDRTGDMILYTSLEYRFPIYSILRGGLFYDAGNIWLRQDNPDFPNGTFRVKNMFNQLAMDVGLGLRFDFSFFILRVDWATRFKNPQYQRQWFNTDDFRVRKAIWNFGIGYPF